MYTAGGSGDGVLGALGDRGTTTTTTSSDASGFAADPASAPADADDRAAAAPWSDAVPPHVLETPAFMDAGDWPDAADAPGTQGAERIVTGSDGSAWYTADHYSPFTRIR